MSKLKSTAYNNSKFFLAIIMSLFCVYKLTSSFHLLSDLDLDTNSTPTTALTLGLFICSNKLKVEISISYHYEITTVHQA